MTLFVDQLTQIENLNQAILQEVCKVNLFPKIGRGRNRGNAHHPVSLKFLKSKTWMPWLMNQPVNCWNALKATYSKNAKKDKPLPPIKPEEIPFEIPESWFGVVWGDMWCKSKKQSRLMELMLDLFQMGWMVLTDTSEILLFLQTQKTVVSNIYTFCK